MRTGGRCPARSGVERPCIPLRLGLFFLFRNNGSPSGVGRILGGRRGCLSKNHASAEAESDHCSAHGVSFDQRKQLTAVWFPLRDVAPRCSNVLLDGRRVEATPPHLETKGGRASSGISVGLDGMPWSHAKERSRDHGIVGTAGLGGFHAKILFQCFQHSRTSRPARRATCG